MDPAKRITLGVVVALAVAVLLVIALAANGRFGIGTATPRPTAPAIVPSTLPPGSGSSAVLVGAGDIASCSSDGDEATAALLDTIEGTVFTLGDNVYENGSTTEFDGCYEASWGRHRARTMPVPGNHDYNTLGATGYFAYYGPVAGDPSAGYYAYDRGAWRIYALNSNCAAVGGCAAGSAQEQWLRADLAASPRPCALAMWHHPLFSSGGHGNNAITSSLWEALYDANADLVLVAHDHSYERFAPQTATGVADAARGLTEIVVGTGGRSHYGFETIRANSLVRDSETYGVLRLELSATGWSFDFLPVAGKTFTDSGSGTCH